MSKNINISLTTKGTPTIDLKIGDEAKNIIESNASSPVITFVATGSKGEQGVAGTAAIDNNSVTATQIADGTITSAQIQNGTISSNDIGAQQIITANLGTNSVTTEKINADAVTGAKIADNSIQANHIVDGTIVKELITDLSLTGDKIADASITTIKISNGAITDAKLADKTITGGSIVDNVELGGTTKVVSIQVMGSSPGYIHGPVNDTFYIQSKKDLIFVCDSDQEGGAPNASNFRFQNALGTNLFVIDESGNTTIAGNVGITGNITLSGTVDGIDIATAVAANTAKQTITNQEKNKVGHLTVTQAVDLDAMETKLNGITDNEAIDWTTDQGSTNIHAGNYTDTNTQLSAEEVQDIVGAMLTGNTETNIAVTYQDDDGTIDFVSTDTNTTYSEATSSDAGLMSTAHHDKLDGIETSADVTDATNVTAAGALMDSEVTNLAQVKAFSSADYATAAQGAKADSAQQPPSEGAFANGDKTKLDGIETGATADQTKSDINGLAITTVGTIGTGVWQGTAIASNYLDSDTAHLSGVQTFLGPRTFAGGIIYDGDRSATPGDGAAIHVDASDITDNNTSTSGTATAFNHVNIENPRVLASNASVTTTTASTVYIKGAPVASTNQTITNAYALNIAAGNVKLGAGLEVVGDITVTGNDIKDSGGSAAITFDGSANTAVTGNLNVTGIITGKQRQIYQQSFIDDLGTTKHYLPWRDTDEQTTIYQEEAAMVAPYDGRIVSVTMRCSALSGSGNRTIGIHTFSPNGSQFTTGNWTEEEVEAVAIGSTDDNHVFYFVFDNAKHFESGELITLSIQDDSDLTTGSRYTYVSTVVEWDYNNGLGTGASSAEYDAAQ